MLDILFGVPPIIQRVHGAATFSTSDIVAICVIAGLVLATAITLVIAAYRSAQKQAQVKEVEQPPAHVSKHIPEEEKIPIPA